MPVENRKLRVFLCHASQDKLVVRELYQRLLAEGWIDPWLDEEKLLPGQDWDLEIENALEYADAVLVCLSMNSVNKEGYVQKELRKVLDISLKKPDGTIFIIPLRLDECQIPIRLKSLQYINYYPEKLKSKSFQKVLKSLEVRLNTLYPPDLQDVDLGINDEAFVRLTQQEKIILLMVSEGKTNREIADILLLGVGTVRSYIKSYLLKLGITDREEAVNYAQSHNLKEVIRIGSVRNFLNLSIKKKIRITRVVVGEVQIEFVEITNRSMFSVNMTNWKLYSKSGNEFTFPTFSLRSGGSIKLWTKGGINNQSHLYWGRNDSGWNNKKGTIYLEDSTGTLVDSYTYFNKSDL